MTLLVLGIDGAVMDYVEEAFEKGAMPNLKRLADQGALRDMDSSNPPITIPAWPSMFSGLEPDKFDTYHMTDIDSDYDISSSPSSRWNGRMLWDRTEGQYGLINIPGNSPVRPVNGYMIEGFPMVMNPDIYPGSLKNKLPDFDFHDKGDKSTAQAKRDVYMQNFRERKRVFSQIDKDVDVRIEVYQLTDTLAHVAKDIDQIIEAYSEVDDMIGERMKEYDDIMVVSDHGFTGVEKFFYINTWLEERGFLNRKNEEDNFGSRKSLLSNVKKLLIPLAETSLKPYLKQLNDFLKSKSGVDFSPNSNGVEDIDFSSTEAFSFRSGANIYGDITVNDGRFSEGVVDDREDKITEIKEQLEKEKFVEDVWRREELYDQPENMPDIIFRTDLSTGVGISLAHKPLINLSGYVHSKTGILGFRGPSFKKLEEDPNLEDVAPTIAYYLGQDLEADGEPMDVFVDDFKPKEPSKSENISEIDI